MKKIIKLSLVSVLTVIFLLTICTFASCTGDQQGKLEIVVSDNIDVNTGDSIESVKQYLVVTYIDVNGNKKVIDDYQLLGTLTEGSVTLTIKYQDLTAFCSINVKANTPNPSAQYDIVFKADGVVVETLHYSTAGDTIVAPQVPAKKGYNGEWEQYSLITGNIAVNAIYTAKTYVVLLDYDGAIGNNLPKDITVTYGQPIGTLPKPTKTGYMFSGWFIGEDEVDSQTIWDVDSQEQLTLKAQWRQLVATEGLIYTLNADGESYTVTGIEESSISKDLVIPSIYNGKPVTRIESGAFATSKIISAVIPESITSMGAGLFNIECLDKLYYLGSVSQWCNIVFDNTIFNLGFKIALTDIYMAGEKIVDLVIPDGVTRINSGAFAMMTSIRSVTIPSSVKSIGDSAFGCCFNLREVTFSEGLTTIGNSAFLACASLTEAQFPNSLTQIDSMAFFASGIRSVVIPAKLTEIGSSAFCECLKLFEVYNLSSLQITVGSSDNGYVAFYAKYVYADLNEPHKVTTSVIDDGYEFAIDGEDVYLVGYNGNNVKLVLPTYYDGKAYGISGLAFGYKMDLVSITIPKEVLSINEYSFVGCTGLKDVYFTGDIADWCNLGGIGNIAEGYNVNIHINGQILSEITSLVISDRVTIIPNNVFSGCAKLTTVTLGRNVNEIVYNAFDGCDNIDTIYYEGDIAGWCAIKGLGELLVGTNMTVYVNGEKLNDITRLTIPEGVSRIGSGSSFKMCDKLTELTVLGETEGYGNTFEYCPIEKATVPMSFIRFLPKSTIKTIIVTSGETVPNYCFNGMNKLEKVVLSEGITTIERDAFGNNNSLISLSIPNSIRVVDKDTLPRNSNLQYAVYDNAKYLGNDDNPYVVLVSVDSENTSCKIHDGTKIICAGFGCGAFEGHGNFEEVTIPVSITKLDSCTFNYCSELRIIRYEGTIVQWNAIELAFQWYNNSPVEKIVCTDGEIPLR